jgi:FkbM family methyltransferase
MVIAKYKTVKTKSNPRRNIDELQFKIRPNTTDAKVIDEVITKNTYEKKNRNNDFNFEIGPGQTWLDLGGNIGTFSVLALEKGADKVITYEPESENYELLKHNLSLNRYPKNKYKTHKQAVSTKNGKMNLHLCKGDYNKYRHSLIPIRGRETTPVSVVSLESVRKKYPSINSIKMDIEGAEIDILEKYKKWEGIDNLVFEYSFDVDNSIPRFMKIIDKLKKKYDNVLFLKVKPDELEYNHFPRATMVYCYND